jgi:hypothetical protein
MKIAFQHTAIGYKAPCIQNVNFEIESPCVDRFGGR